MINTDLFDKGKTVVILGKNAYSLRFTMREWFEVEKKYGTLLTATGALFGDNSEQCLDACVFLLSLLSGVAPNEIRENLVISKFETAIKAILSTLQKAFSENDSYDVVNLDCEENHTDWDWNYYLARNRFSMTLDEFWECTPRQFNKFMSLWRRDNCIDETGKKENEIFDGPLVH
jgi:hypothetical protein